MTYFLEFEDANFFEKEVFECQGKLNFKKLDILILNERFIHWESKKFSINKKVNETGTRSPILISHSRSYYNSDQVSPQNLILNSTKLEFSQETAIQEI